MYAITFPVGFIVPIILPFIAIISVPILLIAKLLGIETYIIEDIIFPWIGFLLLGYIQWFIFIPKLKK
jgi:hypothetical protein